MPVTPEALLARFQELGFRTTNHRHPPVFTVEESKQLRGKLPGGHCKSLFVKDKADRVWLVVALEDRPVDLKRLRRQLGAKKTLSFGNSELLMDLLGVTPGSVTPFGVVNDREGRVTVVLEERMMGCDPLNYHPLVNSQTTSISPEDLVAFLRSTGHEPLILDFDAPLPAAEDAAGEG